MQQYPFTKFNQVFDIITRDVIRNVIMRLNCTRRDRERIYFSKSHDIPESRFPLNRLPPLSLNPFLSPPFRRSSRTALFSPSPTSLRFFLPTPHRQTAANPRMPPSTLIFAPFSPELRSPPSTALSPTPATFLRTGRKSARDFYFRT